MMRSAIGEFLLCVRHPQHPRILLKECVFKWGWCSLQAARSDVASIKTLDSRLISFWRGVQGDGGEKRFLTVKAGRLSPFANFNSCEKWTTNKNMKTR